MNVSTLLDPVDRDAIDRISTSLLADIDGAKHVATAIVFNGVVQVVATTDPTLDVEPEEGPTSAAARSGRIHRIPSVHNNAGEYPAYVRECTRVGIASVAAVPVKRDGCTIGVVTITSADHHGFGADDLRAARRAAAIIAPHLQF
ncbi:MAG: hypothetical protein JWM34_1615 [Ilumatobacteraceae bacterium]|nr:hypothetical protein [Ilumatobacteraceae bacterium]